MIEREYYPLEQATEILPYSRDDLIHFGAGGKLPIYILTGGFLVMPIWMGDISLTDKIDILSRPGVRSMKRNMAKLSKHCLYELATGNKKECAYIEPFPYFYLGDDEQRKSGVLNFGLYYEDRLIKPSAEDYERFKGFADDRIFDTLQHRVLLKDCKMVILSDDLKRLQEPEPQAENVVITGQVDDSGRELQRRGINGKRDVDVTAWIKERDPDWGGITTPEFLDRMTVPEILQALRARDKNRSLKLWIGGNSYSDWNRGQKVFPKKKGGMKSGGKSRR